MKARISGEGGEEIISFWFIYFSEWKTLPKKSQSQTFKHSLRCSVRPFLPLLIPGSPQTENYLIQCLQFLARLKIKFKDWITPTQPVLFCPSSSSISLSKMSSVSMWTRGFCFIISSPQHLKALGAAASGCSRGRNSLQSSALSPPLLEEVIPFLELPLLHHWG